MNGNEPAVIHHDFDTMATLRQRILAELLPALKGKQVICLDIPIHLNIGDLLIEKGTYRLFQECNAEVVGRVALLDKNLLFRKKIPEDVVLVLLGGGTFGDIYPHHQEFRLRVIEHFPDNPIIMLPQSLHYDDENQFLRQVGIMQKHRRLKLYMRDQYSHDYVAGHLDKERIGLLPDTATLLFGDWEWPRPQEPPLPELLFRRNDIESRADEPGAGFDWRDLVCRSERRRYRRVKKMIKWQGRLRLDLGAHALWPPFRDRIIEKAASHYSGYGRIDTDRLHGFILSQLMGIPVVCRDNTYGKISRYIQTWDCGGNE